ncbi:MAG TPA: NAD(P)/FAD-dependent oxidoreductase [Xanthobacteraceae bacterium]|nr:NAD(P)/FAD-dependent oxidoreductase [Xanthobacteraceae bacterium]
MAHDDVEVVVVGGGAAGVAAARRLHEAGIRCVIVEARARFGGRAWTITDTQDHALDLGCGWLHSAEHNPWREIAQRQGATIDQSPASWMRPSPEIGFPRAQQAEFREAFGSFFARLEAVAQGDADVAAAAALEAGCRWNGLIDAIGTYITGAEWDRVSAKDFDRYADTGVNWRVIEGLGAIVGAYGAGIPALLDCAVHGIDHGGRRLKIKTAKGAIAADQVIVTVPSALLASERIAFTPALPEKTAAARGLPLGIADKLFMALDGADDLGVDVRLFGATDRAATAAYNFRPLGRPTIEAYFGGSCAAELEKNGDGAFFDFAVSELTRLLGADFARRVRPIRIHRWGHDPFALGSYSFARPGFADCRATLAAPVDDRLFFAGEACSIHDFSTAHGAFRTGVAAADQVIAARAGKAISA